MPGTSPKKLRRTYEHPVIRRLSRDLIKSRPGLALVDLLVAMALMGISLAITYQYFFYTRASWERAAAESRAVQDVRLALGRMEREVREARTATAGGRPVELVSASQVRIYTDLPGTADGRPEMVVYRVSGGSLQRGVAPPIGNAFPYTYGTITNWQTVLSRVDNSDPFSVDTSGQRNTLTVNLRVNDAQSPLRQPVEALVTLAVRSRGEAE